MPKLGECTERSSKGSEPWDDYTKNEPDRPLMRGLMVAALISGTVLVGATETLKAIREIPRLIRGRIKQVLGYTTRDESRFRN